MVETRTTEAEWLDALDAVPRWTPPLVPTVVVAPHPDDETLATGGLIAYLRQRGVPVQVVAVTDGEAAYAHAAGLASMRILEQEAALAQLGVSRDAILRLHLEDSNVAAGEATLAAKLLEIVTAECHLVAPWQHDWHPDHEACGRAARQVASQTGAMLSSWFFWTWHTATPDVLDTLKLKALSMDGRLMAARQRALACHASQLAHASGEPILPESFLAPARRPIEVFANA